MNLRAFFLNNGLNNIQLKWKPDWIEFTVIALAENKNKYYSIFIASSWARDEREKVC